MFDQIYQPQVTQEHGERCMAVDATAACCPGFGLTLGFTLLYLSLIVLIPLARLFLQGGRRSGWDAVLARRHRAARGRRRTG